METYKRKISKSISFMVDGNVKKTWLMKILEDMVIANF
jgi:hypothetical protein